MQTYYLLDNGRLSSQFEIAAMRSIKKAIRRKYPDADQRLLPAKIFDRLDFPLSESTKSAIYRIRKEENVQLGVQYSWLARFAECMSLSALELSIHADDKAHEVLKNAVERVSDGEHIYYQLHHDVIGGPFYDLFRSFRLPLFGMTKLQMQTIAGEYGFDDILEQTWFCHSPRWGSPCGTCNPCMYTIEEGLGRRLPLRARLRYSVKTASMSIPGCYGLMSRLQKAARKVAFRREPTP